MRNWTPEQISMLVSSLGMAIVGIIHAWKTYGSNDNDTNSGAGTGSTSLPGHPDPTPAPGSLANKG